MFIELRRAWTPKDMREDECGICGHTTAPTTVIAERATDGRMDMGTACPACIAYLGSRNPEASPTIERYLELLRRFPEPMYASQEELEAAYEDEEDPTYAAYEEAWVWRLPERPPW